jgi:hypothetical protein
MKRLYDNQSEGTHIVRGYIVYTRDQGLGLSPGSVRTPTYNTYQLKYNVFDIYNKAHTVVHRLGGHFEVSSPTQRSRGRLRPTT